MNDTSKVIDILEELGCTHIQQRRDEIRACRPEGSNPTSVQVMLVESLYCNVHTKPEYANKFEYKDIFTLVQYFNNCSMSKAVKWICGIIGIEYEGEKIEYTRSETVKELRRFKPKRKKEVTHEILDENFMESVEKYIVPEWVEEGIIANTQSLFEVFIDRKYKRWFFPIRNHDGDLVSTKGRTFVDQFKLKGVMKFVYNPNLGTNDILFGYYLTQFHIAESKEMILFEGEKSVMKAFSMNVRNTVAVGKNGINPMLIKAIIKSLAKSVVIAYDKDVPMSVIQDDIDKLKHYKDVYYIWDKTGLLGEKDCPIDKGLEVWEYLYKTKRRGK